MNPGETLKSPRGVYKIVKKLGSGAFGNVYLTNYTTTNTSNSEQIAMKEIILRGINEEECKKEAKLMEEISRSLKSQHIVKYFDSFMITGVMSPNCGYLYIAMDYCSRGDLSSKIEANVRSGIYFEPKIVYDYIYQIADGINELHKHNIVHRDLKPANIPIAWENGKEVLKISDFGLAKMIDPLNKNLQHTRCGTLFYMAPEQYSGKYHSPVDIWAIGIIFYELCIAPKRLQENEMANLRRRVDNGQRITLPSQYSAADTTWLNEMIAKTPDKRMSAEQVCVAAKGLVAASKNSPITPAIPWTPSPMHHNDWTRILFYPYYPNNNGEYEGRICLFNSFTCSVEEIAKFHNWYLSYQVATTQDKIFAINNGNTSFEIYDLNTRQISRGPDPPEWREWASVAYFKNKLYYLGGIDSESFIPYSNRVDVLINGQWQTGSAFPLPIDRAQTITCDQILYVIDGWGSRKIYRLSDDERKWIEIGEIPGIQVYFGVASLNGRIYITGGRDGANIFKSCLCFDPSAPVDSRISQIADMNYARLDHLLIVANGKLYAIGGRFQKESLSLDKFCNSIEEYDPQTNKWRKVGRLNLK